MSKKILVVDDSATVRQQVRLALTQVGFEVCEAGDGFEGLEELAKNDVSLVVCDVNMPLMDGLAMLEKLRENPEHATLNVIMLTTEGDPQLIQRAKRAGAKGWMVKPFKAEALVAVAKKLAA